MLINMSTLLTVAIITTAAHTVTAASRPYTFHYRDKTELKITVNAESNCAAYRKAARMCFNILTGGTATTKGTYPGEEAGMEIIDTCANPTNYKLD